MKDFLVGVAVFVAIVILASEVGVGANAVGREIGEAISYAFSVLGGLLSGLFSVGEAVG